MDHGLPRKKESVWKGMTGRQRLEHFWTYYKLHLAAVIVGLTCLLWFVQWLGHRTDETLLYLSLVDFSLTGQESQSLQEELEALVQREEPEHQKVVLDSSLRFDGLESLPAENRNGQLSKQLVLLDTGMADVYLASTAFYDYYKADGWFLSMEEVLGERYEELAHLVTEEGTGLLLPQETELWGTYPEQVCLMAAKGTDRQDNIRRLVDILIPAQSRERNEAIER